MGTIIINIKDEVEKEFRDLVKNVHGTKKGDLDKTESGIRSINISMAFFAIALLQPS